MRRKRLQQREFGGQFAKVGPKPGLVHFLIAIARVAQKDADLAGGLADIGKGPGGGAANLPVVQPDIGHLACGRKLRHQGKDRHACGLNLPHCLGHDGMHGGHDADGLTVLGQPQRVIGGVLRRKIVEKFDPEVNLGMGGACRRTAQGGGYVLIERAVGLQQQDAKAVFGATGRDAGLNGAKAVKADSFRRLLHQRAGGRAHIFSPRQHAVDGCDRQLSGICQITNGGAGHNYLISYHMADFMIRMI